MRSCVVGSELAKDSGGCAENGGKSMQFGGQQTWSVKVKTLNSFECCSLLLPAAFSEKFWQVISE
jgi:hypothetical protein